MVLAPNRTELAGAEHARDRTAFGVSSSLVDQARERGRVVHVPIASADPVASQFTSVRREGISSGIALPIAEQLQLLIAASAFRFPRYK